MSKNVDDLLNRAIKNAFEKVFIIGKYENGDVYIDGNLWGPELLPALLEAAAKSGFPLKLDNEESGE